MSKDTVDSGVESPVLVEEFDLAKRIHKGVCRCAEDLGSNGHDRATYLWICVSKDGVGDGKEAGETTPLTVDEWLNVVDEAASIGVTRLVVSAKHALSDWPDLWQVCEWAQNAHDMVVVLHTNAPDLDEDELSRVRSLEPKKTRLLLSESALDSARSLEPEGVVLCPVDHGPLDRNPCEKPGRMVFVNPQGTLYTCGLVEGVDDFNLGDIHSGSFLDVLKNPDLPHEVADQERFFAQRHSCDGCPALARRIFEDEA